MENTQPLPNQQSTEPLAQQQANQNNNKLFVVVSISILLTAMITGSVVYFWQKSTKEKLSNSLEQRITILEKQVSTIKKVEISPQPTSLQGLSPTQVTEPATNLKKYSNEKYRFSFNYPQNWKMDDVYQDPDAPIFLSNIAKGHTISVHVYRVTGFGYCYEYGERKEIVVGGKTAETADGVGASGMCDKPEEFSNRGNTFVLIPLEDKPPGGLPTNQIHISYDYPLDDISIAKSNLDQILSTFKFTD